MGVLARKFCLGHDQHHTCCYFSCYSVRHFQRTLYANGGLSQVFNSFLSVQRNSTRPYFPFVLDLWSHCAAHALLSELFIYILISSLCSVIFAFRKRAILIFCSLSIFFIFGGFICFIAVFVLSIPSLNLVSLGSTLRVVFCVHPTFAVGQV